MGAICHVLESAGIATVGLSSMRDVSERLRPPRTLFCQFPLGRPLGKPLDPEYQHRVLAAALRLFDELAGPVIHDYPDVLEQDLGEAGAACALPPLEPSGEHRAVAEARALIPAYNRNHARSGRTNVGQVTDRDGIPALVGRFVSLSGTGSFAAAELSPDDLIPAATDVRAFYEEASAALLDHVPEAGQTDVWFFHHTATGAILRDAWRRVWEIGLPGDEWVYFIPEAFYPENVRETG